MSVSYLSTVYTLFRKGHLLFLSVVTTKLMDNLAQEMLILQSAHLKYEGSNYNNFLTMNSLHCINC